MYAHKRGRRTTGREARNVLLHALSDRSPGLGNRPHGVAALASTTAEMFSLPADEVQQIRQAAELYNVGKIAIPDAILEKPAPLDENEWDFIHRHPLVAERLIAAASDLREVATLVRSTHEHFDGTGYPDALTAQQIPLGARIIAVCDAYDAMTSDRPYRPAMDQQAALTELHRCAGTQSDPVVVMHFCEALTAHTHRARRAA